MRLRAFQQISREVLNTVNFPALQTAIPWKTEQWWNFDCLYDENIHQIFVTQIMFWLSQYQYHWGTIDDFHWTMKDHEV